jgi:hypothetical protein
VTRRRLERQLDALRDGLLDGREVAEIEDLLTSPTEAVRQAWQEGPEAPPAERILAAIRPAMARIDAEVDAPSRLARWLARVREVPRLAPSLAATGAALILALAIFATQLPTGVGPEPGSAARVETAALPAAAATVYNLVPEAASVMLYEAGDVTILWVTDDEEDVSRLPTPREGRA